MTRGGTVLGMLQRDDTAHTHCPVTFPRWPNPGRRASIDLPARRPAGCRCLTRLRMREFL